MIWTWLVHTENTLCSHGDHFTLRPLPDYEKCVNGVWIEHGWSTLKTHRVHHVHTEHGDCFTLWPFLAYTNCVNMVMWFEHGWSTQKTYRDHTVFTRGPLNTVTSPWLLKLFEWCVIWKLLVHTENTLSPHSDHFTLWPLPDFENCVNGVWFEHYWFIQKTHSDHTVYGGIQILINHNPFTFFTNWTGGPMSAWPRKAGPKLAQRGPIRARPMRAHFHVLESCAFAIGL